MKCGRKQETVAPPNSPPPLGWVHLHAVPELPESIDLYSECLQSLASWSAESRPPNYQDAPVLLTIY